MPNHANYQNLKYAENCPKIVCTVSPESQIFAQMYSGIEIQ